MERQVGESRSPVTRMALSRAQRERPGREGPAEGTVRQVGTAPGWPLRDTLALGSAASAGALAGGLPVQTIRETAWTMQAVLSSVGDPSLRTRLADLLDDLQATTAATPADELDRALRALRRTVGSQAAALGQAVATAFREGLASIDSALDTRLDGLEGRAHGLLQAGQKDGAALLDKADGIGGRQLDLARSAGTEVVEDAAVLADTSVRKALDGVERVADKTVVQVDAAVQKAIGGAERAVGGAVKGAVEAVASAAAGIAIGAGAALLAGAAAPVIAVAAAGGLAVGLWAWLLGR